MKNNAMVRIPIFLLYINSIDNMKIEGMLYSAPMKAPKPFEGTEGVIQMMKHYMKLCYLGLYTEDTALLQPENGIVRIQGKIETIRIQILYADSEMCCGMLLWKRGSKVQKFRTYRELKAALERGIMKYR